MSWWSKNSKPGVKSSNPGFEVSICCFYNLGKAKMKNFRGKTTHQKELYIKWSHTWDSVPAPQIPVSRPPAEAGNTAGAEGRTREPPLWRVHSCISVGPQRPGWEERAHQQWHPHSCRCWKQQAYSMVCWKDSRERPTSKLEDWGLKVLEICLLPGICFHPYFKNWIFF